MKKDSSVTELAILACLKYWPQVDPHKEISFLNEIDLLLNQIKDCTCIVDIRLPLIKKIATCAQSKHYAVAERALLLILNPTIVWILKQYVPEEP